MMALRIARLRRRHGLSKAAAALVATLTYGDAD